MIGWIKVGVGALAIAGLYSIILVILRTPQISNFIADQSIFKSALVIHVNLSVLVWLLSITAFFWSLSEIKSIYDSYYVSLAFIAMILMAISPLMQNSVPVMNNYVPMLENIYFILGLSLFGATLFCLAIQTLILLFLRNHISSANCLIEATTSSSLRTEGEAIQKNDKDWIASSQKNPLVNDEKLTDRQSFLSKINVLGKLPGQYLSSQRLLLATQGTTAVMFLLVWLCCILSYFGLDALSEVVPLDLDYYYEILFWSGGHLLQFIYTQILMLVLLILAEKWRGGSLYYVNAYEMLLMLNFFLSLFILVGHFYFEVSDGSFKQFFTHHMIYTAGIAPTFFILLLFIEIINKRSKIVDAFVPAAFLCSSLVFLSGGLIGAFISGVNVTIPAHYHGSIVGISIAFMGLVYLIPNPIFKSNIVARRSPIIIGFGLPLRLVTFNLGSGIIYLSRNSTSDLNCLPEANFQEDITTTADKNFTEDTVISHIYSLLPDFIQDNSLIKNSAAKQIYIITFGQLLHIIGLSLAGGYGVLRKTPGQEMALSAKLYMGMVGIGGLIAIIGGLMFVYICGKRFVIFK